MKGQSALWAFYLSFGNQKTSTIYLLGGVFIAINPEGPIMRFRLCWKVA